MRTYSIRFQGEIKEIRNCFERKRKKCRDTCKICVLSRCLAYLHIVGKCIRLPAFTRLLFTFSPFTHRNARTGAHTSFLVDGCEKLDTFPLMWSNLFCCCSPFCISLFYLTNQKGNVSCLYLEPRHRVT